MNSCGKLVSDLIAYIISICIISIFTAIIMTAFIEKIS